MLIQDHRSEPKITILDKTHAVLSLCLSSLPLSPFHNISLSLSVCVVYDSPVMISHKKRMMFLYDDQCLIDNKSLRMHSVFHLNLRNDTCTTQFRSGHFTFIILFSLFTKQATLMRSSTVLSLPSQLVCPDTIVTFSGLCYEQMIVI